MNTRRLPDPDVAPTITAAQLAAVLGVGVRTVLYRASSGEIPSIRIGRRVVFPTRKVLAFYGLLDLEDAKGAPVRAPIATSELEITSYDSHLSGARRAG